MRWGLIGVAFIIEVTISARSPTLECGLVTLLRQVAEAVSIPGKNDLRIAWKPQRAEVWPLWVDEPAGP